MPIRPCPRCGAPLPGAADAVCPICAGRLALATNDGLGERLQEGPPPGQRVGHYELREELGRGAMGVVYRAHDTTLGRDVALKIFLSGQFASESERRRFFSEAEIAAALDHPNLVAVHEFGEADGRPFLVLGLVEGRSLATLVREGFCSLKECPAHQPASVFLPGRFGCCVTAAALMAKVARAVHHAHQRGILHRDLKPANILVDAAGEPHVADFGLAKRLDSDSGLTLTGAMVGTPAYMAPEQVAGNKHPLTTAADLYSLGAILYELLTGQPPFQADSAVELARKVIEQTPRPPRALKPRIGRDLEVICLKCLAKEPARRYASAGELADDLERWLRGEPIRARRVPPVERLWLWAKRRPAIAALVVLLHVVAAVGLAGVFWQWHRAEHHADTANAANRELLSLVNRLEHERAEERFTAGDSPRAVAMLAHGLHRDPANRAAAERLLSALAYRPFLVPVRESPPLGRAIVAAHPTTNGLRLIGVLSQQLCQAFEAASSRTLSAEFVRGPFGPFPIFSRDGRWVALVNSNQAVELRAAVSGELVGQLTATSERATNPPALLRFSPDSTRLLGGWKSGVLAAWRVPDGKMPVQQIELPAELSDADLSADGTLATVTADGRVRVWETETSRLVSGHAVSDSPPRFARWSPDGRHLAVVCGTARLEWRDARTGVAKASWICPEAIVSVTCGADDDCVLVQGDTAAFLWSASRAGLAGEPVPRRANANVELTPAAQQLHAVSSNGCVRTFQRRVPLAPRTLDHGPDLLSARWSDDGLRLLSLGTNGTVRLWESQRGQLVAETQVPGLVAWVTPDLETLLVLSNDTAFVMATRSGEVRARHTVPGTNITSGAIHPDGECVALGRRDGLASHWWWRTNGVANYHGAPYQVRAVCWSADGHWSLARWGTMVSLYHEAFPCWWTNFETLGFAADAVFSADSRRMAVASLDYRARVWGTDRGALLNELAHEGPVQRAVFSPDARRLATLVNVKGIRANLWQLPDGTRLGDALAHPGDVLDLAFSPDSRRLATVGADGTARVWDAATALPVSEPLRHEGRVLSVRFSPQGETLLTAAADGRVRLWNLPLLEKEIPAWLPAFAEALAGLRLSTGDAPVLTPWPDTAAALTAVREATATNAATRWVKRVLEAAK